MREAVKRRGVWIGGGKEKKEECGRETAGWKDAPILHGSQTHLQHIYYRTALQSCCSPHIKDAGRRAEEHRAGEKTEIQRATETEGTLNSMTQIVHSNHEKRTTAAPC